MTATSPISSFSARMHPQAPAAAPVGMTLSLADVVQASPDLLFVLDVRSEHLVWSSAALVRILGWTAEGLSGAEPGVYDQLVHPDDVVRLRAATAATGELPDGGVISMRSRVRHLDGRFVWLSGRLTPFARDETGRVTQVLGVARDVSDIVEAEQQLALAALHDPLTGLANRALLADRLRTALLRHTRTGQVVPVLFCDLDGFKHVNDTCGHHAGDRVLVETARRLRSALRPQDTIARVGGDEFVVVLEPAPLVGDDRRTVAADDPAGGTGHAGADRHWDVRTEALAVADRLMAALSVPVVGEGDEGEHVVTVSIGLTFARPGSDPDEALRDADSALYRAKGRGKNRHEIFDGSFRTEALERGHIEHALRAGLAGCDSAADRQGSVERAQRADRSPCRLSVVYQPVFDLAGPRLVGVEALARLTDRHGLPLQPADFIPVAEDTGLIAPLGRVVLEMACRDLADWHAKHPAWRHLGVAVNLSARQAGLADLVADVRQALHSTGLAPGLLTLELTESVLLEAGQSTLTALTTLTADGVRLAIDDFGTGYASLRYLAQLPVTSVKIDRSFTAGLPDDPTSATIVRTVAGLARDLGITCVVEGVETDAQLVALPPGVHGQGYLLGRPQGADQLDELLAAPSPYEHDRAQPALRRRRPARRGGRTPVAPAGPDGALALDGLGRVIDLDARQRLADRRDDTADERDRRADVRDRIADRRDVVADGRDDTAAEHEVDVDTLLEHAEQRDHVAAARDRSAQGRDLAADSREAGAPGTDPAAGHDRWSSAVDRVRGARDRDEGALDRADLTASGHSDWRSGHAADLRGAAARDREAASDDRQDLGHDREQASRGRAVPAALDPADPPGG